MTLRSIADKESLILIGGFSQDYGFLEDVWEFDLQIESWRQYKMRGYGPAGKCFPFYFVNYSLNKSYNMNDESNKQ